MSFFNRLAKLQSDVKFDGQNLEISVYDDEIGQDAIMWMTGNVTTLVQCAESSDLDEEEAEEVIMKHGYETTEQALYIGIINFNDKVYFSLPQRRQDMMSTVLLKKFISFYQENFGKGTSYWMPVLADFANYQLQEKFKDAVDKGIFPKISKDLIGETTESDWQKGYYNMDNRKSADEALKGFIADLGQAGIEVDSNYMIKNENLLEFSNTFRNLLNEERYASLKTVQLSSIFIGINGQDLQFILPFNTTFTSNIDKSQFADFVFVPSNDYVTSYGKNMDYLNRILGAEQNIRYCFEGCTVLSLSYGEKDVDSFLDLIRNKAIPATANVKNNRLVKKSI